MVSYAPPPSSNRGKHTKTADPQKNRLSYPSNPRRIHLPTTYPPISTEQNILQGTLQYFHAQHKRKLGTYASTRRTRGGEGPDNRATTTPTFYLEHYRRLLRRGSAHVRCVHNVYTRMEWRRYDSNFVCVAFCYPNLSYLLAKA